MPFSIGQVFSVGSAIARLLDGEPPGVVLGGISLDNAEAPERLGFGGDQQLVVHRIPGGARVVDAMGPDDRDIKLSGFLEGADAMDKARSLDAMRSKGGAQTLTWADERRQVVVRSFECDYQYGGYWISYSLVLLVLPPPKGAAAPSPSRSLFGDLAKSLGLSGLTDTLKQAQGYLTQAQAVIPVVAAVSPRLAATVEGYSASASGVLSGAVSVSEGRLAGLSTTAYGVAGFTGQSGARQSAAQTAAAQDQMAAVAAQSFAARAQGNAATLAQG